MSETPLSQRIHAPALPELPRIDGLVWRPPTLADLDAVTVLLHACSRADHPHYLIPREEIADDFESTFVDLRTDMVVGVRSDGSIIAYGSTMLLPGREGRVRSLVFGGVHPQWRGRGIGRALLGWQEARGLQQLASCDDLVPGWLMGYAEESATATMRLFARTGFEVKRYYLGVTRVLADPIVPVPAPEGISIREFDIDRDAETVRLAKNDAFRDHWGTQPSTEENWGKLMRRSTLRPDLSFVAVDTDGAVAGFTVSTVDPADWEGQGFSSAYVDLVGVPRAFRGRRIAPALLAHSLRAHAAAGLERTVLDVDAENPSGALALYEGVGFTPTTRSVNVAKVY